MFPVLQGATQAEISVPTFYLPDPDAILSTHETKQLEEIVATDTQALEEIGSLVTAPRQTLDVDSLLHSHRSTTLHETQTHYYLIVLTSLFTIVILVILAISLHTRLRTVRYPISKLADATPTPNPPTPAPRQDMPETGNELEERSVVFASYPAQQAI